MINQSVSAVKSSVKWFTVAAGLLAAQLSAAQAEPELIELPPPGQNEFGYSEGISSDGFTVVGGGYDSFGMTEVYEAFIWSFSDGYTYYPGFADSPAGSYEETFLLNISGDGRFATGSTNFYDGEGGYISTMGIRWEIGGEVLDITPISETTEFDTPYALNMDGSVIVGSGYRESGEGAGRSFVIWTEESGGEFFVNPFAPGENASFYDVNADGTAAVGYAYISDDVQRPILWTREGGFQNLGTPFPTSKETTGNWAYGISDDGTVVVGSVRNTDLSPDGFSRYSGFIWEGGEFTVIDHPLPDSDPEDLSKWIFALDISGNGNVVVGQYSISGDGVDYVAYLYTRDPNHASIAGYNYEEGLQSVVDWLEANGVVIAEDAALPATASAVNEDGTVITGELSNDQTYIATLKGFVDISNFHSTLATIGIAGDMSLSSTNLIMHGAHSQPLMRRVGMGKFTAWAAGDYGRDDHGDRNGDLGLAEVGAGYNFGPVQLNLSIGQTWSDQDLALGGEVSAQGQYVFLESSIALGETTGLFLNLGGYGHWGDADITRGYLNAGTPQYSTANPDTQIYSLRARIDWFNINGDRDLPFSPYLDYSFTDAQMDSYTETGGGFPAMVGERSTQNSELRFGGNFSAQFGRLFKLLVNAELAHRLNDSDARSTGTLIGVGNFNMPGRTYDQTWFKGGIGFDSLIGPARFNLMLNGTSEGEQANLWLASGLQFAF